jgi:hypothetical protein
MLIKAAAVAHLFRNTRGGELWNLSEHASGVLKGNVRSHPQPCRVTHPAPPPCGGAEGEDQQGEGEEAHRAANSDCSGTYTATTQIYNGTKNLINCFVSLWLSWLCLSSLCVLEMF